QRPNPWGSPVVTFNNVQYVYGRCLDLVRLYGRLEGDRLSLAMMSDDVVVMCHRQWLPNQKALYFLTSLAQQECELVRGLDAFRDYRQIEAAPQPDDRANDRGGLWIAVDVSDERLIDLDLVKWERLQVGQGRVAGSEIIHGDAHAHSLETAQDRNRPREVVDQHAFGDLQFESAGRQSRFEQNRMNEPAQIAMPELDGREIDGNLQRTRPRGGFAADFAQDPFTDRDDKAAFLGQGNESLGRNEAAGGVLPAK